MNSSNKDAGRSGLRGYVTNGAFGGLVIPVPVQNLVLRDYCTRNGYQFLPSANEELPALGHMQLRTLLGSLGAIQGVVMCSLSMLPGDRGERARVQEAFLAHGAELHFVFESIVASTPSDMDQLDETIGIKMVAKHSRDRLRSLRRVLSVDSSSPV